MLMFLFLAIIYMGIMFLDYTQYSNAARDAARDISLHSGTERTNLINKINAQDASTISRYATSITKLYTAEWKVKLLNNSGSVVANNSNDAVDVEVAITLKFSKDGVPQIVSDLHIAIPITYKMKLEK